MSNTRGGGFFLMIGIIIAAWLLGDSFKDAKSIDNARFNLIKVKGYAQKNIDSDLGEWSCQIKSRSTNLSVAYDILEKYKVQTLNYLKSQGINESDLDISSINKQEIYKSKDNSYGTTNDLEGYNLYMSFTLKSTDLDLIESISRKSTELIKDGIDFQSYAPQYYYTKIEELKLEMLAEASANAFQRAEMLAGNTGSKVGKLISASQGVFQITSQNSTEVSDYGSFDTRSRQKTIKAVITAEFGVE